MTVFKITLIIYFLHQSTAQAPKNINHQLFWNSGQGQWITMITPDECLHFDFGGEIIFFKKNTQLLKKICQNKNNRLFLSHPDLDHYSYITQFMKVLPRLCWNDRNHPEIKTQMSPLPHCTQSPTPKNFALSHLFQKYTPQKSKPQHHKTNKNHSSTVFVYNQTLIPGDSPKQQEKIWIHQLNLSHIRILSLGHHGSKTSTSLELVNKLSQIKMSIAQARFKRYGHPNKLITDRLKIKKIPLLRTEEWGNILIEN